MRACYETPGQWSSDDRHPYSYGSRRAVVGAISIARLSREERGAAEPTIHHKFRSNPPQSSQAVDERAPPSS